MPRSTPPSRVRSAQIHASTVFALTLAIVAGLICAWVFKVYVLNGKAKPAPAAIPPTYRLTVAAVNIMDKQLIHPGSVKTLTVGEEDYNRVVNDPKYKSRVMLRGNQPVSRTTIKPIQAEEPIFEDQLEPLEYPKSVGTFVRPGKRAVIIEVPAREAMIQVGDVVDVLCTLSNPEFGPGSTATKVIAKGLRVIARFNTTRTASSPPPGDTRPYTLEATPYRHAIIELARKVGGTFTLSVATRPTEENGNVVQGDFGMDDPQTDIVTTADLARLFGITKLPDYTWTIERVSGISHVEPIIIQDYRPAPQDKGPLPANVPGTSRDKKPATGTPIGGSPLQQPLTPTSGKPVAPSTPTSNKTNTGIPGSSSLYRPRLPSGVYLASAAPDRRTNHGFVAPIGLNKPC